MFNHWFLIASRREVRIYVEDENTRRLKLMEIITNPLGRVKRDSLIHKQAGRGMKGIGMHTTARYTERKRHDPLEESLKQFARATAQFLERERQDEKFTALTVVAEPHFLGKLRSEMSLALRDCVSAWVKKDLQNTPENLISEQLI